jgi:antibiotic biosynthesis monooxygenase (ABM) superfamily enzyme
MAKHRIRSDAVGKFKEWFQETKELQLQFKGYLSSELIRPVEFRNNEFVSIFRYDSYLHLKAFMDSKERANLIEKRKAFAEDETIDFSYHSLEHFFVSDAGTKPPAMYKMWIVLYGSILSQLQWAPQMIERRFPTVSKTRQAALTTMIVVTAVQFLIVPVLTRLLAFWLFPGCNYADKLLELVPKPIMEWIVTYRSRDEARSSDTSAKNGLISGVTGRPSEAGNQATSGCTGLASCISSCAAGGGSSLTSAVGYWTRHGQGQPEEK